MVGDTLADYIDGAAHTGEQSKSEVARAYLLAGIEAIDGVRVDDRTTE